MVEKDSPIFKEFLVESYENLSNISQELMEYEKKYQSEDCFEIINSIYRKVHTLKGSACFLALKNLESITHSVETLLDQLRERKIDLGSELADLLLESFDLCHEIVTKLEKTGQEEGVDIDSLDKRLASYVEHTILGENITIKSGDIFKDEVIEKKTADSLIETITMQSKAEGIIELKPTVGNNISTSQNQTLDSTVRVNVKLLDKILNVVGELVLNRNQILQFSRNNEEPQLSRLSHQLNVITTELQTDIMTTRMQPVGVVFNKFERIVRDLAKTQNKNVRLEIQGQETELDKTLLEIIRDPLTHLIRNAIDHGIETSEERVKNGKTEQGHLLIKTYHAGGQVVIEIQDDGKGVSLERVLKKAIEKGIVSEEDAQNCPKNKILNFIFHPGFSTADQVTNLSGRGVGMDVVKSNIERIGGHCEIISTESIGTTFKLKIPLTLAIVPALIIKGGNETFAIPQKNLVELVLVDRDSKKDIEKIHNNEFYRLRGELVPLIRINSCLEIEEVEKDPKSPEHLNIVVLNSDNVTYGLVVDEVLDTQEIVVKPLSRKLNIGNIYAGATIMGDGKVALILDALGFFNKVGNHDSKTHKKETFSDTQFSEKHFNLDLEEILLFELEDNRKYGIPLCLVSRLEEFENSLIEKSGNHDLIRYREKAMPLINLSSAVNYKGLKLATDKSLNQEISPSIVSHIGSRNFGFRVKKILDIGRAEGPIDSKCVNEANLMGTTYIDGEMVTIVDIHKVVENLNLKQDVVENSIARVLLAEDSVLYQRVVQDALEAQGYHVTVVGNGKLASELLEAENNFDLLITDIEMPELSGLELVKRIRGGSGSSKNIPVIAITTLFGEEDLKKGREVGINTYLKKLDKEQVLSAVHDILMSA